MPRTRPPYPPKFRRQAVELIRSGTALKQVAAELGVSEQTLRNWRPRRDVDAGRAEGLTTDECEELRRLRRENRRLAQQREIRKAAAASSREDRSPAICLGLIDAMKSQHPVSLLCSVARRQPGRLLRAIGGRARFVGLRGSAAGALARAQFPAGRRAGLGLATRPSAAYLDGHEPARQLAVGPVRPVKARKTGPR